MCGTYLVTLVFNVPKCANLDTSIRLLRNGAPIASTNTQICTTSGTGHHTLHAIVSSDGTTTLSFTAADTLQYSADNESDVLASILFHRIA